LQAINWQQIIEKYGAIVWQTVYRLLGNHADAADCFQETFISALKLSQRQRVRNFSALLAHLATTRAIDRLRQRTRHEQVRLDTSALAAVPSNSPSPAQEVQMQELAVKLRQALAQLPSNEAEVFCLRYLNDMSYRQIGIELGIRANLVGVLLHRVRAKLRNLLEEQK